MAARIPKAPLDAAVVKQLKADLASVDAVKAAAQRRHNAIPDHWDAEEQRRKGLEHFDLACWLHYYAPRVYQPDGIDDRIACALRIFREGIDRVGYEFYDVFGFGERHFDTIFEMGDADEVSAALWRAARGEKVADQIWRPVAGKPSLVDTLRKAGLRSPGQQGADALTEIAGRVSPPPGHTFLTATPRGEFDDMLFSSTLTLRPEGRESTRPDQLMVEVRLHLREYPKWSGTVFAHTGRNVTGESTDLFAPGTLAKHTRYGATLREVSEDAEALVREAIDLYHARFPHAAAAAVAEDAPENDDEMEGMRP